MNIKKRFLFVIGIIFLTFSSVIAEENQNIFSWIPPDTYENGTLLPFEDIGGFKLHWGNESKSYTHSIDVGNILSYTLYDLDAGTYYFAATCYVDNPYRESDYSNEIVRNVTSAPSLKSRMEIFPTFYDKTVVGGKRYKYVTVKNTGEVDLNITSIQITGRDSVDFYTSRETPFSIIPNGSKKFSVYFQPKAEGYKVAYLILWSNDPYLNGITILLNGVATK